MKELKSKKKKNNAQVLGKQLVFVTSSGMMVVFCILIGYFIGNKFSEKERVIGVVLGSIFGAFLFIGDLYAFIYMNKRGKEREECNEKECD